MDMQNLLPRLLLAGSLVAAIVVYRQQRQSRLLKKVEGTVAGSAQSAAGAVAETAQNAASAAAAVPSTIAERGQNMIESLLDNIADQALKELKSVLKDGLKRLDKAVDA